MTNLIVVWLLSCVSFFESLQSFVPKGCPLTGPLSSKKGGASGETFQGTSSRPSVQIWGSLSRRETAHVWDPQAAWSVQRKEGGSLTWEG